MHFRVFLLRKTMYNNVNVFLGIFNEMRFMQVRKFIINNFSLSVTLLRILIIMFLFNIWKCMRLLQVAIRMCFISKEHKSGVITREKKKKSEAR